MRKNPQNLELADVIRTHLKSNRSFLGKVSLDKRKVLGSILSCRTSALGGHISQCTSCGHLEQSYNSCWNRHCPKCQGGAAFGWVSSRREELLPVAYFHMVFTLPGKLRELCFRNKRIIYDCMFRASSESLKDATKTRHKVTLGFFGILHTWNQELQYHPHIHFVVPAGGLTAENTWQPFPNGERFFLPVRVLSKLYQGKLIELLKDAYRRNVLYLENGLSHLNNPREFEYLLSSAASSDWVVYAKRPFSGPETVLKYLASYTHRIGISNSRLRSLSKESVSFLARDRGKNKQKKRLVTLSLSEFIRRFLLHLIPKKFRRIRYFGFLINQHRKGNLDLIRAQLHKLSLPEPETHPHTCQTCHAGLMKPFALLKPHRILKKPWIAHIPFISQPIPFCLSPPSLIYSS